MKRVTETFLVPWQAADYAGLKLEAMYELLESGRLLAIRWTDAGASENRCSTPGSTLKCPQRNSKSSRRRCVG